MDYATDNEILEAYQLIKNEKPTAYLGSNNYNKVYKDLSLRVLRSSCLTTEYMVEKTRTAYYIAFRAKAMDHNGYKQLIETLHTSLDLQANKAIEQGKLSKAKSIAVRRARKRSTQPTLDEWDKKYIDNIYKTSRWLSTFCEPYHVDHIIPLAKGGKHTPGNLQILPAEENRKKSDSLDFYSNS